MFITLSLALFAAGGGFAPHSISGLVSDSAGSPLANVRVTVPEIGGDRR